jgi:hypothetical protein
MSEALRTAATPPSVDPRRAVDRACDRFESAWRAGVRPRIEEFFAAVPDAARQELLRELIALDADYRRRAGEDPRPGDYRALLTEPGPEPVWLAAAVASTAPSIGAVGGPESTATPAARVGRYRLLSRIGAGPDGASYRALGPDGRQLVELIDLSGARPDADRWSRLAKRLRLANRLVHPAAVVSSSCAWRTNRPT